MSKRSLFWILTLSLIFIFQATFSRFISIKGISPNLLLLVTVFLALRGGPEVGVWVGFVWGFLSDITSISIFGSQTFMFTLIGYNVGRLQGKIDENRWIAQMVLVLAVSIFYLLGLIFFEALFGGYIQRFKMKASIYQPIYSTLICPVIFWLMQRWYLLFHRPLYRSRL